MRGTHTHTHTYARTHARTHAHTSRPLHSSTVMTSADGNSMRTLAFVSWLRTMIHCFAIVCCAHELRHYALNARGVLGAYLMQSTNTPGLSTHRDVGDVGWHIGCIFYARTEREREGLCILTHNMHKLICINLICIS